jgi:hypothetical protein
LEKDSLFFATFAHAAGVAIDLPWAQVLFHAATPFEVDAKQPALTPE